MDRRKFIQTAGLGATAMIAGCLGDDGATTEGGQQTLVVGTYGPFVDAPSTSPGAWVKEQFESEFDGRLVWQTPTNDMNYYIERRAADVDIDADMYIGLNTDDLVTIDSELDDGLFEEAGDIEGSDVVKEGLDFDPQGRAIPYGTGYISLVYDSTATEAPMTFDGLLEEEHQGDLITQNPASSTTGRAFLLHTIHEYGEDEYLDYWADLQDNDVRVLGSWGDAYGAWQEGEAPMVVSYSTDQVFANMEGANLDEHQIRFLNDQAYANPEGMAVFQNASEPELARDFMSFLLEDEIQGELAERNVMFPASENAVLPDEYEQFAQEPPEPVTFSYDELQGSMEGWVDNWEREFSQN
jgi:thiamine transport system substrate-binding protein